MLSKKDTHIVVTPIPGFIPRQLALDILHSHGEIITLNPLVLSHRPITAPRNASPDEFYSTWYEITERIQYVPGMGKIGSGQIQFNGCFHNMPWGLQTHIYAPMGIDLRHRYRIAGNQPGIEPPEPHELGNEKLGVPKEGLYLRTESEIKCNIAMMSFVKGQLKQANKLMVDRIIKKAELLDAGILQAMMEDGKLKTVNPNDRSQTFRTSIAAPPTPASQHGTPYMPPVSPDLSQSRPNSVSPAPYHSLNRHSSQVSHFSQQFTPQQQQQGFVPQAGPLPSKDSQGFAMELPGDMNYLQTSPPPPNYQQDPHSRHVSVSSTQNWQGYAQGQQQGHPAQYEQPQQLQPQMSFTAELGNTEIPHAAAPAK